MRDVRFEVDEAGALIIFADEKGESIFRVGNADLVIDLRLSKTFGEVLAVHEAKRFAP